jgi:hypothetical protein
MVEGNQKKNNNFHSLFPQAHLGKKKMESERVRGEREREGNTSGRSD